MPRPHIFALKREIELPWLLGPGLELKQGEDKMNYPGLQDGS